ncbi:MAG: prepilin-type N-terminal cleavage/methylation domain-containing protein [Deltaproteobacteria bacterium]|nr:prepilin-type N-terminal cleavage/methylation domain-containing protein [Deltaproteobacteria bacterium]
MMFKRQTSLRSAEGFTLIEVMIAIAILAVIAILVFMSTSQTINSKEDTEKKDNLNHSVNMALNKMVNDLQMSFLLVGPDFLGSDGRMKTVFKGTEDKLDFPTLSKMRYYKNSQETDYGEVGYFLQDDPEQSGQKLLMRRESKRIDDKPEEGGVSEPIVDGIKELHFEYYDAQKKEWLKAWDSSQLESANRLPRAVRMTIKVVDADSEDPLTFSTMADIRLFKGPIAF